MIVFDLACREGGHKFEGWFGSSDDFARQQERGLVTCPVCGADEVDKVVSAPSLGRKGNQLSSGAPRQEVVRHREPPAPAPSMQAGLPPQVAAMLREVAKVQAEALKTSRWVGGNFAKDARAMHYGERDNAPNHGTIHGRATLEEARELLDEGIPVAPILVPFTPPDEAN